MAPACSSEGVGVCVCQGSSINDTGRHHTTTGITLFDLRFQKESVVFVIMSHLISFLAPPPLPVMSNIHASLFFSSLCVPHTYYMQVHPLWTVCMHAHNLPGHNDKGLCLPVCHSLKLSVHPSVTSSPLCRSYLSNNPKLTP